METTETTEAPASRAPGLHHLETQANGDRVDPRALFSGFLGREVSLRVEIRGGNARTVVAKLDSTATAYGATFLVLSGGTHLIRANAVVECKIADEAEVRE